MVVIVANSGRQQDVVHQASRSDMDDEYTVRSSTVQVGGTRQSAAILDEAFRAVLRCDLAAIHRCASLHNLQHAVADQVTFTLHTANRPVVAFSNVLHSTNVQRCRVRLSRCSLLHCAAFNGREEMLQYLLTFTNVDSKCASLQLLPISQNAAAMQLQECTAAHIAVVIGRGRVARLLQCDDSFELAAVRGLFAMQKGGVQHLCTLLSSFDSRFVHVLRQLCAKTRHGQDTICSLVHTHQPAEQTVYECTALHIAVTMRNLAAFCVLVSLSLSASGAGEAKCRECRQCSLISRDVMPLARHADANAAPSWLDQPDALGNTALDYAVADANELVVTGLLRLGASCAKLELLVSMASAPVNQALVSRADWLARIGSEFRCVLTACDCRSVQLLLDALWHAADPKLHFVDRVARLAATVHEHPVVLLQRHHPLLLDHAMVTSWMCNLHRKAISLHLSMVLITLLSIMAASLLSQTLLIFFITLFAALVRLAYQVVSVGACSDRSRFPRIVMLTLMIYSSALVAIVAPQQSNSLFTLATTMCAADLLHQLELLTCAAVSTDSSNVQTRTIVVISVTTLLVSILLPLTPVVCFILPAALRIFSLGDTFLVSEWKVRRAQTYVTTDVVTKLLRLQY